MPDKSVTPPKSVGSGQITTAIGVNSILAVCDYIAKKARLLIPRSANRMAKFDSKGDFTDSYWEQKKLPPDDISILFSASQLRSEQKRKYTKDLLKQKLDLTMRDKKALAEELRKRNLEKLKTASSSGKTISLGITQDQRRVLYRSPADFQKGTLANKTHHKAQYRKRQTKDLFKKGYSKSSNGTYKKATTYGKYIEIIGQAFLEKERIESSAKNAVRYGVGNCDQCAALSMVILLEYDFSVPKSEFVNGGRLQVPGRKKIPKDKRGPWVELWHSSRFQYIRKTNKGLIELGPALGGHAFVVVNRNQETPQYMLEYEQPVVGQPNQPKGVKVSLYGNQWIKDDFAKAFWKDPCAIVCDPWAFQEGGAVRMGEDSDYTPYDELRKYYRISCNSHKLVHRWKVGGGHSERYKKKVKAGKKSKVNYWKDSIEEILEDLGTERPMPKRVKKGLKTVITQNKYSGETISSDEFDDNGAGDPPEPPPDMSGFL